MPQLLVILPTNCHYLKVYLSTAEENQLTKPWSPFNSPWRTQMTKSTSRFHSAALKVLTIICTSSPSRGIKSPHPYKVTVWLITPLFLCAFLEVVPAKIGSDIAFCWTSRWRKIVNNHNPSCWQGNHSTSKASSARWLFLGAEDAGFNGLGRVWFQTWTECSFLYAL